MRKRISKNIRWSAYLLFVISVLLLFSIIYSIIYKNDFDSLVVKIIFFLGSCFLTYSFDNANTVEFDEKFMYVIGKGGEEKIPLKSILKIKLTMTRVNDRNLWKIKYHDEYNRKKSVRFIPLDWDSKFDEFKKKVLIENEKVEIQNWSHSFDFDQ